MRLPILRRPLLQAAAAVRAGLGGASRPGLAAGVPVAGGGVLALGRRQASVKAQGAYKKKNKRGIPKKLGAKRTGDQYVIPGSIIYKQRGTLWWPGENCFMGRDHTIHAGASGYVKYYRDPGRHPDRKYIGVVFDKTDRLPYPRHAERKRRLNMTTHAVRAPEPAPALSPSGIPYEVRRVVPGAPDRLLRLRDDYSYREDNWRIGRLVRTTGIRTKRYRARKKFLRQRRWRREQELEGHRRGRAERARLLESGDEQALAAARALSSERAAKRATKALMKKKKRR